MATVKSISVLAKKLGFKVGDDVITLGGYPMQDILDYLYYDNENHFDAQIVRDGKTKTIKVHKKDGQGLGLEFNLEMKPKVCRNKCIFCFVDQLPKGLRDTLYIKDDDYRFSFISGSYVTMTNVSEEDIERIIRLKLSPLYISVHAYDDQIRTKMLRNPNSVKLIPYMKRLGENGIKMHTQLVIVPTINDGEVLEQSIRGLSTIKGVETIAVVPVGLTGHRCGLDNLPCVDCENAVKTIKLVEKLHCDLNGICWCADEYYVKAGLNVKPYEYYADFEQIENGVGLLADFKDNFEYSLATAQKKNINKRILFVTGVSFKPLLEKIIVNAEEKLGITAKVVGIENNFFGKSVTVAGLVTAGDIIEQIKGETYDAVCLPDNMLREFSDVFLDNVSLKQLEENIGAPVIVLSHNGADIASKIIEFYDK